MPHIQVKLGDYSYLSCHSPDKILSKIIDRYMDTASPTKRHSIIAMVITEGDGWDNAFARNIVEI